MGMPEEVKEHVFTTDEYNKVYLELRAISSDLLDHT
jgi:hypothetical protein